MSFPSFFFRSPSLTISTPRGSVIPVFSAHTRSSDFFALSPLPRSASHVGDSSSQKDIASASVGGSAVTNASSLHPPGSSIHAPRTVMRTTPTEKERLAICKRVARIASGHASASMSTGTNAAPTPRPTAKRHAIRTPRSGASAEAYPPMATIAVAMMVHGLRPTASASAPMRKHPSICPAKMLIAT